MWDVLGTPYQARVNERAGPRIFPLDCWLSTVRLADRVVRDSECACVCVCMPPPHLATRPPQSTYSHH